LTLSLLTPLSSGSTLAVEGAKMGVNYGCDKVRFMSPVKVNSEIRARVKLVSVEEKEGNRILLKNEITMEIKGEERPALIAEWLTMVFVG
jgi:acyl dehydratase